MEVGVVQLYRIGTPKKGVWCIISTSNQRIFIKKLSKYFFSVNYCISFCFQIATTQGLYSLRHNTISLRRPWFGPTRQI